MGILSSTMRRSERRKKIRDMSIDDARQELAELRFNLFNLRMQTMRGEVKDYRQFATTRKDIAAIVHKLHMAQLEQEYGLEFIEAPDDEELVEIAPPVAATALPTVDEADADADVEDDDVEDEDTDDDDDLDAEIDEDESEDTEETAK